MFCRFYSVLNSVFMLPVCFKKWERKEKGDSRSVWRCDRLICNHTKHMALGGAAASFSFSVKDSESIEQSMTGLPTAGGRKAEQREKLKSANFQPEGVKKASFSSLIKHMQQNIYVQVQSTLQYEAGDRCWFLKFW